MSRSRGDELETTTSAEMRRLAGEVDSMRARHKDEVSGARFHRKAPLWFPMILAYTGTCTVSSVQYLY